jgi:hypothetical protein
LEVDGGHPCKGGLVRLWAAWLREIKKEFPGVTREFASNKVEPISGLGARRTTRESPRKLR